MSAKKIYVGVRAGARTVFRADSTPTTETHGTRFVAVIGPFRTVRGARFMAECGSGNPHVQCVADAERIAARLRKGVQS